MRCTVLLASVLAPVAAVPLESVPVLGRLFAAFDGRPDAAASLLLVLLTPYWLAAL